MSGNIHKLFIPFFIICFFKINAILNEEQEDRELIFVYQHARHGARGPSAAYNSLFINGIDEFNVSWKGEGDGELTLLGRREHYDLGVRNRHKYGENGLGLINFSTYNPEEVLFHVSDYNRTHQSLNSELLAMYQPGTLKNLPKKQVNESFPPNKEEWNKKKNEVLYQNILDEILNLDNQTIIDNIPVFNVHPFGPNRIFNLESNCKNLDDIRKKNLEGKNQLLYGYFLKHKKELINFFEFKDESNLTDIKMMNSITDHYISDYINMKDLTDFKEKTQIDLEEFLKESEEFYYKWMYNYYCTNESCVMESSRLMEDLLGYMERRIKYYPKTTYYAPKLVMDCGHDTTVAPIQMFMYEAWKDKPSYGVKAKYCGYSCNLHFELYKSKNEDKYYVYYFINDELINIFDYKEFKEKISAKIYKQEDMKKFCKIDEVNESNVHKDESFSESLKNHKSLWSALFIFIFTTIFGIVVIICLILRLKRQGGSILIEKDIKNQELSLDL